MHACMCVWWGEGAAPDLNNTDTFAVRGPDPLSVGVWGCVCGGVFPLPPLSFQSLLSPHQAFDDFIFAFFAVEMVVKMVALGIFGKKCYLGDTWNRLDFFIVIAG